MTTLYNRSTEKEKRRSLRNDMPPAEKLIWQRLRGRQIEDCKFRRQYSIGAFVVDFYVPELKLALEIDGDSHFVEGAKEYDNERIAFLEDKGTNVLRFTNQQIYEELDAVIERITETIRDLRRSVLDELAVQESTPPQPSPCKGEGVESGLPPLQGGIKGGHISATQEPTLPMPSPWKGEGVESGFPLGEGVESGFSPLQGGTKGGRISATQESTPPQPSPCKGE